MSVPFLKEPALCSVRRPPSICTNVPLVPLDVCKVTLETEAILASASPRNPSVRIRNKSCSLAILLVAWRENDNNASSASIPTPLSMIWMDVSPASISSTSIAVLPASMAFSTNSLTTEVGRSTTSPAAILLDKGSSINRMTPMISLLINQFLLQFVNELQRFKRCHRGNLHIRDGLKDFIFFGIHLIKEG